MFERVVLATDGSVCTERAIEVGLDLTERFGADLHAITVVGEGPKSEDDRGASDREGRSPSSREERRLRKSKIFARPKTQRVFEDSSGNRPQAGDSRAQPGDQGDAQAILDGLRQRVEQCESRTVHTSIETGDPKAAIPSYAERVSADLITLGTRGRDSPHRYHLGSVAESIVYDSPIPVLTVRELNDTEMV